MFTYIWIEGWENLAEFCEKRFRTRPRLIEHHGSAGSARIHKTYKADKDGDYHEMYFLYMEHPKGQYDSYWELNRYEKSMDYEQIRLDRGAILKR